MGVLIYIWASFTIGVLVSIIGTPSNGKSELTQVVFVSILWPFLVPYLAYKNAKEY